jgi:putative transposase
MAKSDRFVVELPLTQMGDCMIGLGTRSIPVDFEETVSLTESEMDAWTSYRVLDRVAQACKQRGFGQSFEAQHLRIVPVGRTVKFEVVIRVQRELDPNSILAKIECSLGDDLKDAKGAKTNELLIGALRTHKELSGLHVAGVDFGVKNTASIAFGNGQRAIVIGSGRLESFLDAIDAKLDSLVSRLTTPEIKVLTTKQTELLILGQKLSRSDLALLRKGLKAIFANPEYRELRGKRERWLSDYLHKLSFNLVGECAKRGVEAIVLGENKGWKDGMNMGVVQNRRFGNVPIARLIELIRYKANAQGLVVVTTEESYTSKTSFVSNEALKVFDKARVKKSKKESNAEVTKTSVECAATACAPEAKVEEQTPPIGKRLKDKRNTFVNHHQTGRWAKVHADVNAAFNIIRKVFKDFVFTDKLTLKYNLMRVSPRLGLTHIRI